MHRDFKRLLRNARGESEFVIALNIDIRGFSEFSMTVDSSETAIYVKRVYAEIIEQFFPKSKFFKPTGDGLLVIEGFTERTLERRVFETVNACLTLVKEFPNLTSDDRMINFEVPPRLGIGASRGAACRLVSGTKTLDYSGRVLNLASRLMMHARPKGLVFDSAFGPELLTKEMIERFDSDTVFLKGIAEDTPVTVYYSRDVKIDEIARRPLSEIVWLKNDRQFTLRQIKDPHPTPYWELRNPPTTDPSQIQVKVIASSAKQTNMTWDYKHFTHDFETGVDVVRVNVDYIPELVKNWGVRRNDSVITVRVFYPTLPSAP